MRAFLFGLLLGFVGQQTVAHAQHVELPHVSLKDTQHLDEVYTIECEEVSRTALKCLTQLFVFDAETLSVEVGKARSVYLYRPVYSLAPVYWSYDPLAGVSLLLNWEPNTARSTLELVTPSPDGVASVQRTYTTPSVELLNPWPAAGE